MLTKGVHPYEYLDSWEGFNKTELPTEEEFYCNLNLEDITNADSKNAKKDWKDFELKNLGDFHGRYVQNETLLLAHLKNV